MIDKNYSEEPGVAQISDRKLSTEIEQELKKHIKFLLPFMIDDNGKRNITEKVLKKLECFYCKDYLSAPIFIVNAERIICEDCNEKEYVSGKVSSRFMELEELVEAFPYPCKYQNRGCEQVITLWETCRHEKLCRYRSIVCSLSDSCGWYGMFLHFIEHCKVEHKDDIKRAPYVLNEDFKSDFGKSFLLTRWNFLFLTSLNYSSRSRQLCISTYLLGDEKYDNLFYNIFKAENNNQFRVDELALLRRIRVLHAVGEQFDVNMTVMFENLIAEPTYSISIAVQCNSCLAFSPFAHALDESVGAAFHGGRFYCSYCKRQVQQGPPESQDEAVGSLQSLNWAVTQFVTGSAGFF